MSGPTQSVTVGVEGLRVLGRFGVSEVERAREQGILVDLAVCLRTCGATRSDEVVETADYHAACELVAEVAGRAAYKTLERFCDAVAEELEATHARAGLDVASVRIKAAKTDPPIERELDRVSVELFKEYR